MIENSVVVLGGGGIWGAAWMTGIIMGLAEHGVDLAQAQRFIGTSAGAMVGAQLARGHSMTELFIRQTDPTKQPREHPPRPKGLAPLIELLQQQWESPEARRRAIAALALNAEMIDASQHRADVIERLGEASNEWPTRVLSVTAVDTATCELCVFNRQSGVGLIEAVAASCAVPGVSPPMRINGRLYMDGGLWRNGENVHLACGERLVLIISPFGVWAQSLQADIEELRQSGSRVALIAADDQELSTLGPFGPLDPSFRAAAAEAGRDHGHREAEKIHAWLGGTHP